MGSRTGCAIRSRGSCARRCSRRCSRCSSKPNGSRRRWSAMDEVVAQRDSAALAATFLAELRSENLRLRGLLGLGPRLGSGYIRPRCCTKPSRPTRSRSSSLRAQAGCEAPLGGRQPGGLVGIVSSVDAQTSVVVSWRIPSFAPARWRPTAACTASSPHTAAKTPLLAASSCRRRLQQLVPTAPRSSPRGRRRAAARHSLGTVVGVAGEAGVGAHYLVRPAVHPAGVTHVMILTGAAAGDLRSLFEAGARP